MHGGNVSLIISAKNRSNDFASLATYFIGNTCYFSALCPLSPITVKGTLDQYWRERWRELSIKRCYFMTLYRVSFAVCARKKRLLKKFKDRTVQNLLHLALRNGNFKSISIIRNCADLLSHLPSFRDDRFRLFCAQTFLPIYQNWDYGLHLEEKRPNDSRLNLEQHKSHLQFPILV